MTYKCISVGKPGDGGINEDAVLARPDLIAVSDGAGGGGLFADRWSRYLVEHLPDTPICGAEELDAWIGDIWEPFYNACEEEAKLVGGMTLDKFYDEGAFATLVAVWKVSDKVCKWINYGDSVAFHYNYSTKKLEHSFASIVDFDKPPYLINCKDEIDKDGVHQGIFYTDSDSVVFATSDALAHYILMMYEVCNKDHYVSDIQKALVSGSKNENFMRTALSLRKIDFEEDVINKLQRCVGNETNFLRHIKKIYKNKLLAYDDYSIAILHFLYGLEQ